jgi:hypothetical protein
MILAMLTNHLIFRIQVNNEEGSAIERIAKGVVQFCYSDIIVHKFYNCKLGMARVILRILFALELIYCIENGTIA